MGTRGTADVVERMIGDAAFRMAVQRDPLAALAGYDLTDDEKRALGSRVATSEIGLDARVTKRYVAWSDRDAKTRWTPAAERMATDPAFRDAVRANPTAALGGYDLTADEIAALAADGGTSSIGLDARVTKARGWSDRDSKTFFVAAE